MMTTRGGNVSELVGRLNDREKVQMFLSIAAQWFAEWGEGPLPVQGEDGKVACYLVGPAVTAVLPRPQYCPEELKDQMAALWATEVVYTPEQVDELAAKEFGPLDGDVPLPPPQGDAVKRTK